MMVDKAFWQGKKVLLTGSTGFKGSWLSIWLHEMGAHVVGYAKEPPTEPSLFQMTKLKEKITQITADICDVSVLQQVLAEECPDIVIHMAAQPLVREAYRDPVETYRTNVMGSVALLEAVRHCSAVRAVVNVTTDKCYENKEWLWGYRETEELGGYDPYSSSKACSELVTAAYRNSFFKQSQVAIASARAGNVIGGGDWAKERLIPDCLAAIAQQRCIIIRNPKAVRPWQHVLEPLAGYLLLAQRLYNDGKIYEGAWNFGPDEQDARSVEWIVEQLCSRFPDASYQVDDGKQDMHEANYLKLDCAKARAKLHWFPKWNLTQALDAICEWTQMQKKGCDPYQSCVMQIQKYTE